MRNHNADVGLQNSIAPLAAGAIEVTWHDVVVNMAVDVVDSEQKKTTYAQR